MAVRFVNVDRDTPMLLPPDLRDWVPVDDMVHFVIEAVGGRDHPTTPVLPQPPSQGDQAEPPLVTRARGRGELLRGTFAPAPESPSPDAGASFAGPTTDT